MNSYEEDMIHGQMGSGMDWNDEIQMDNQFVILQEGEYVFKVVEFERGYYSGSEKIPACPQANLTLQVDTPEGCVSIRTDLKLCRKMEWLLSSFFCSIGQKKKGCRFVMNWDMVPGARGRLYSKPITYKGGDGTERVKNDLKFLEYAPEKMPGMTKDGFQELDGDQEELPF